MGNVKDTIDSLTGGGSEFWASHGAGNVKKQLYDVTRRMLPRFMQKWAIKKPRELEPSMVSKYSQ